MILLQHSFSELKTFYINFQLSNFDGKGTANVVIKHEDFPDKSFDVGLNTVTGSMSGDQVHEVEFSDEPTPVYIALGDGATGEFLNSDNFVFFERITYHKVKTYVFIHYLAH